MPPFGQIVKTSDDLWKIIAFIRSVNPDPWHRLRRHRRSNSEARNLTRRFEEASSILGLVRP